MVGPRRVVEDETRLSSTLSSNHKMPRMVKLKEEAEVEDPPPKRKTMKRWIVKKRTAVSFGSQDPSFVVVVSVADVCMVNVWLKDLFCGDFAACIYQSKSSWWWILKKRHESTTSRKTMPSNWREAMSPRGQWPKIWMDVVLVVVERPSSP